MSDTYGFYFGQPWWLVASVAVVPLIWLARRNLGSLGAARRILAIGLRTVVILLLVVLLARPMLVRKSRRATVIAVVDRSRSVPDAMIDTALDYLGKAAATKGVDDQLAVVDVAESAQIARLPASDVALGRRNTMLSGQQSRLAGGIEMAMAIAPPDTAARIVLISEGNETEGDLRAAAGTAGANKIPIDVLPLRYRYDSEVLFRRLVAPARARSEETIDLRFLLDSTAAVRGRLLLTLNDRPLDLVPDSDEVAVPLVLEAGTNVKTVAVPVGARGLHHFEAVFLPEDGRQDRVVENNRASAVTQVAGPGSVRVYDTEDAGAEIARVIEAAGLDVSRADVSTMPDQLMRLLDADAVVLANTPVHYFTMAQQEMLCRYVNDLGGGLVMVGGPESFGAGGWIDSPVAEILPVDLDPPQKKQMPRGALALVIDRSGSMTGQKVEICKVSAAASVRLLSRLDHIGVLAFDAAYDWLVPMRPVGEKDDIYEQIRQIGAGGGTIMGPAMEAAYEALQEVEAGVKHVVLLTDGITSDRDYCVELSRKMAASRVSVSTVAVGEQADTQLLFDIAEATKGRFYRVTDVMSIPQIFVKEAQVVRRSMIIEHSFSPQVVYSLSETVKGLAAPLPTLDGHVLTGPKGGLNQLVLTSGEADPILATCQSGLGRCAAFTSSADTRWAAQWVQWPEFARFWEQVVRWAGRPAQSPDCEIFADVQGQDVTVQIEAFDEDGTFLQFAWIQGQVLTPEMTSEPLPLNQMGPGQYAAQFKAGESGSYIVNVQYRRLGEEGVKLANAIVTVPFAPEFRDLSDNLPLLEEVARVTGGRVLPTDPNAAGLYDYAGLSFPETNLPLLRPLLLIWLGLFLLDVAMRRVVIDVRAGARRVRAWFAGLGRGEQDETISRLQVTRQKLRAQWSARGAETVASARYDGGDRVDESVARRVSLVAREGDDGDRQKVEEAEKAPKKVEKARGSSGASHIDQLLAAKRKKSERDDEDRSNER